MAIEWSADIVLGAGTVLVKGNRWGPIWIPSKAEVVKWLHALGFTATLSCVPPSHPRRGAPSSPSGPYTRRIRAPEPPDAVPIRFDAAGRRHLSACLIGRREHAAEAGGEKGFDHRVAPCGPRQEENADRLFGERVERAPRQSR